MTSNKRQRELARAKHERQQARRAAERARRRRLTVIVSSIAGVVVVAAGLFLLLRSSSTSSDTAASPTPTPEPTITGSASPTATPSPSGSSSPSTSPSPSPSGSTASASCSPPPSPRADDQSWPSAPPVTIKPTGTYTMTLATNCGDITMTLDAAAAPQTTNSMVFLADQGYFNLTSCHRLTTEGIFVLQCGDPTATGSGTPGYTVPDENLPADGQDNYPAGTVAMANAGPGTAGSQFFIVYKNTTLPPNYTIWGTVTSGLDVVQGVAAQGVEGGGADGPPAQPIMIEKATTAYTPASS